MNVENKIMEIKVSYVDIVYELWKASVNIITQKSRTQHCVQVMYLLIFSSDLDWCHLGYLRMLTNNQLPELFK